MSWSGTWKSGKSINLGGRRTGASRNEVLKKARKLRDARENLRKQEIATICLQRVWRSFHDLSQAKMKMRDHWDAAFGKIRTVQRIFAARKIKFTVPAASLLPLLRQLGFFFSAFNKDDLGRLELFAPVLRDNLQNAKKGKNIGQMVINGKVPPLSKGEAPASSSTNALGWSWCLLSHRFILCCTTGIQVLLRDRLRDAIPEKVLRQADALLVAAQTVGTLESLATPISPDMSSLVLHFFMRCCVSNSRAPTAKRNRLTISRKRIGLFSMTAAIISLHGSLYRGHEAALDALAARAIDLCALALLIKPPGKPSKLLHSQVRVSTTIVDQVCRSFVEHFMTVSPAIYHHCCSARELLARVARTRPCFLRCLHALSDPSFCAHTPTQAADALVTLLLCRKHFGYAPPREGNTTTTLPRQQLQRQKEAALTARACVNLMRLGATKDTITTTTNKHSAAAVKATTSVSAATAIASAAASDESDSDGDGSMFSRKQGGEKFGVEGVRRATVRWIREKPHLLLPPPTESTVSTSLSTTSYLDFPAQKRSRHSKTLGTHVFANTPWVSITHPTMTDWGEAGAATAVASVASKWSGPTSMSVEELKVRQERNLESMCESEFLRSIVSAFYVKLPPVTSAAKATATVTATTAATEKTVTAGAGLQPGAVTAMDKTRPKGKTSPDCVRDVGAQSLWLPVATLYHEVSLF